MATIILRLRDREMSRTEIVDRVTRIGRDVGNQVQIDNPGVSRVHASIRYQGNGFHVVDEGSANGIYVNGEEVDTCPLKEGDEIQIGKFTAMFSLNGGAPPSKLRASAAAVARSVNPVETTSISLDDLKRMIDNDPGAASQAVAPPPIQPSTDTGRRRDTYVAPPPEPSTAQSDSTKGQQVLLLAVGALGAMVLVLGGLVLFLTLRG